MNEELTLKDYVLDLRDTVLASNETLLNILDALGGKIKEGTLLANYPRSGQKTLGIGTISSNTVTGNVVLTDASVERFSAPIPGICQSLLLYTNREIDLELKAQGTTSLSTSIIASWMRFADVQFDEINIVTSVATKIYVIISNARGGVPTLDRLIQKGIDENLSSWDHGHKTVAAAGTAEQMTAMDVPNGIYLTIRALIGNVGNVYIGNSKANAEDANKQLTLQPGESSSFKADDTDLIWIDADNNGEGIEYWY
jgi:hypothetical protein